MDFLTNPKYELIRRDVRTLKKHIVHNNLIHDWDKIVIVYNIYLLYSFTYNAFKLIDFYASQFLKGKDIPFHQQFLYFYMSFYCICCIKSTYLYFIKNIYKVYTLYFLSI